MSDIHDRVHAACIDVVAVEHTAPGMVQVVTINDSYQVDAREERCECPDWEYNLDGDGRCKHLWAALDATGQIELGRHDLTESLADRQDQTQDTRVLADGGGQWTVVDHERGNRRTYDSRAEAEAKLEEMSSLGADDVELVPPGETDGGQEVEVVDAKPEPEPAPEPVDDTDTDAQLPERSVADDPINWMPSEFVDEIDGTPAINRKGFEVLAHFYDIDVSVELRLAPEETDHEECRAKATATRPDGTEEEAFGTAHVERGDDPWLLVEMAGTRARKRALSIATGAGAVAVAELKNEVDR